MSKNRIFSLMLAALMCMSLIVPVSAASKPTLTLSGASAEPGDTVTLTVSIKDNPGIAGCELFFYYDIKAFSLVTVKMAGDFLLDGGVLTNDISVAEEKGRYDGKPGENGTLALWSNYTGEETKENGEMMEIILKVRSGVTSGVYPVELGYSKLNTFDENGKSVSLNTVGSEIVVAAGDGTVNEDENDLPQFDDVSGNWAEEYIMEAAERGIVVGDKGHYYPNDNMTRAEFVMILWRVMGSPAPKGEASFIDLTADWYKEPIAWAEENKIVDGYGDGIFDPNGNVTREQMMTILHRLAGRPVGMEMMFTSSARVWVVPSMVTVAAVKPVTKPEPICSAVSVVMQLSEPVR